MAGVKLPGISDIAKIRRLRNYARAAAAKGWGQHVRHTWALIGLSGVAGNAGALPGIFGGRKRLSGIISDVIAIIVQAVAEPAVEVEFLTFEELKGDDLLHFLIDDGLQVHGSL